MFNCLVWTPPLQSTLKSLRCHLVDRICGWSLGMFMDSVIRIRRGLYSYNLYPESKQPTIKGSMAEEHIRMNRRREGIAKSAVRVFSHILQASPLTHALHMSLRDTTFSELEKEPFPTPGNRSPYHDRLPPRSTALLDMLLRMSLTILPCSLLP